MGRWSHAWSHYQFNDSRLRHPRHALWFFPGQLKLRGTVQKRTFLSGEIAIETRVDSPLEGSRRHLVHNSKRILHFSAERRILLRRISGPTVARRGDCGIYSLHGCRHRLPNFQLSPELVP